MHLPRLEPRGEVSFPSIETQTPTRGPSRQTAPLTLEWRDVAPACMDNIRWGCDRIKSRRTKSRGRAADDLLVCLAASLATIQANYFLASNGKTPASFSVMDVMRLPLGILTGMGFVGAGTVMQKGDLITGSQQQPRSGS